MASRPLTSIEIESLTSTLTLPRDRCLFILGLKTGFRISELLSITLNDVLHNGSIRAAITVKRSNMKGKHSSRTVPLHKEAQIATREYVDTLGPVNLNSRLFPFSRMTAHRILRSACDKANVEGKISSHSMRKTFGMRVYEATDYNIVAAQKALGHKSLQSTSHYLSVDEDIVINAILGE